jgi:hypothetical protein
VLALSLWLLSPGEPEPRSKRDLNRRFVTLGRAYLPQLGKVYASAWNDGATALDAGESVSRAIDIVAKRWSTGRTGLYDSVISPELAEILPESVRNEEVTPAQRAAVAAAWRGLAIGLSP